MIEVLPATIESISRLFDLVASCRPESTVSQTCWLGRNCKILREIATSARIRAVRALQNREFFRTLLRSGSFLVFYEANRPTS